MNNKYVERTGIILAGGVAEKFGCNKGLVDLAGKPLVMHVIDRVKNLIDEVIVVVASQEQKEAYLRVLPKEIKIQIDLGRKHSPLIGALTGFTHAKGTYSLLLPCDTPFISKDIIELLFEATSNLNATIPRWPNGCIEPLQAVYRTEAGLKASEEAVLKSELGMQSMVSHLRKVRYFSTLALRELDRELLTFFNVNSPLDLKKATRLIKKKSNAFSTDTSSSGRLDE
ncbi:hypothetical protein DRO35_03795 [Candidatus Bathyarchaeota archaeon]|nr:MAG: hypothetical protein DRO35_03795 [Candidatus Bathyarchaeota archaeon]